MLIDAPCGPVFGRVEDGVASFRGIPFAEAPVGPLRFAPPQRASAWTRALDATANGPIAPQTAPRAYAALGNIDLPQSEDCLNLTLWRPEKMAEAAPVIVWIHGGGFMSGSSASPWYDGGALARRAGAVVVGINYRLGALGFLCYPSIITGNNAVLDQLLALQWVQANIAAFGGDSERVTVMGQSGGGHNIAMLLTLVQSKGLFSRAILLSPPLGIDLHTPGEAQRTAHTFMAELGINANDRDSLQSVSTAELLRAQTATAIKLGRMMQGDLRPAFMPARDGAFALKGERLIDVASRAAASRKIEIMISWTAEEAKLFYWQDAALAALDAAQLDMKTAEMPAPDAREALADVRRRKPGLTAGQAFVETASDIAFRRPALEFADAMAANGGTCLVYEFAFSSPNPLLGACHCLDLPFLFGTFANWKGARMLEGISREEAARISAATMGLIADFATGAQLDIPAWSKGGQVTRIADSFVRTD